MTLETQIRQIPKIMVRTPSAEVTSQVERGRKFIVVEDDFSGNMVPQGYTLIRMNHKGDQFRMLVPQSLLFFVANPGEGDPEEALDETADFYKEIKDFEEGMIAEGKTSVQEANWATLARGSYDTYLVNRLVRRKINGIGDLFDEAPEFNPETLKELDLNDKYVEQRVKAIAAIALEKKPEEIKFHEISDVLKHVTVAYQQKEKVTRQELKRVRCDCGSHYEWRDKYVDVIREEWVDKRKDYTTLNSKIGELEGEIKTYREQKNPEKIGRHDDALIRQYANLAFIIPENPGARLDITPPGKDDVYEEKIESGGDQ